METPTENGEYRDEKGRFTAGNPGGPGRPQGSVSPITALRQMFAEDPEDFLRFVKRYKDNPNNEKHVVEMLDHKPKQDVDITSGGEQLQPILVKFLDDGPENNGNTEGV